MKEPAGCHSTQSGCPKRRFRSRPAKFTFAFNPCQRGYKRGLREIKPFLHFRDGMQRLGEVHAKTELVAIFETCRVTPNNPAFDTVFECTSAAIVDRSSGRYTSSFWANWFLLH